MAERNDYAARADEIERRIAQLQQYRRDLLTKQRAADRKARTHRLIQVGAVIDDAFGCDADPNVLAAYLQTTVRRDPEGNPITVADLQRGYYQQTADRLKKQSEI